MSIEDKIGTGCSLIFILVVVCALGWGILSVLGWYTLLIPTFVIAGYCLMTFIVSLRDKSTFIAEIRKDVKGIKDCLP